MDLIINELKLNDEKVNKLNSQTKKKLSLKNNIKVDKLCLDITKQKMDSSKYCFKL